MAARFDGSTDSLGRSASGMAGGNCTFCCWGIIDSDNNNFTIFAGADNGTTNWATLSTDSDGTTLLASAHSGGIVGPALTPGVWYFMAYVYDSAGTDTLYYAAETSANLSSVTGTLNGIADAWTFYIGNDSFSEWLNGRVQHLRVWTAVLTQAELEKERWSYHPNRTANLWASYPLDASERDYSGNARTMTPGGTVTYQAGPPLSGGSPTIPMTGLNVASPTSGTVPTATITATGVVPSGSSGPVPGVVPTATITVTPVVPTPSVSGAVSRNVPTATVTATGIVPFGFSGSSQAFPVAMHSSRRYLVDQFSNPWLAVGDTAWSIVGSLTNAQITQYLNNRQAKGFNLILLSAPEAFYVATPPLNVDGVAPFTGTPFQSTLNNTYWTRVDFLVTEAASRGMTVLMAPFYLGYVGDGSGVGDGTGPDGWADEVVAATNAQMRTYAGYLHARYGSAQNVMWLIGHDRQPGATLLSRASAFIDQLQNVLGNTQLMTYGGITLRDVGGTNTWGFGTEDWSSTATTYPPDFDTQYDYSEWNTTNAITMWSNASPVYPFLFFEGKYEQENTLVVGDTRLREQIWAPFMAGSFGFIFGNNPIWNFQNNAIFGYSGTWQTNLDAAGSTFAAAAKTIITANMSGWHQTNCDVSATFLLSPGTGTDRPAARFGTGLGLVYHPNFSAGSINLDLSEFSANWATVIIRRIDPVSGAVTTVSASSATTITSYNITAPGTNSDGDNDWIFTVTGLTPQVPTSGTVPPATISVTGLVPTPAEGPVSRNVPVATVTILSVVPTVTGGPTSAATPSATITIQGVNPTPEHEELSQPFINVKLGTVQVQRIYVGDVLAWETA